ncbi:DUF6313 family protein [Streptomyces sp. NBC_00568]|jgi:hypothetical protein|uniref:DUF6313 family protein n=1 Tax=Streptomyces sp. NBC_00568 TaxID=2975779 RepID=UPI00338E1F6B
MRSLDDLAAEGGDAARFADDFINNPHRGNVQLAKDHWTRTIRYIADHARELESLDRREAERRAEDIARMLAHGLARAHKCWACGTQRPSMSWWRRRT